MADKMGAGGVVYQKVEAAYFEKRGFRRYAGVWSLWALGVGAVISGHYSGWNLGLATGGWGGMLVAGIIIMIMYLGLVFCIAEMAPALPHTGRGLFLRALGDGTLGRLHHRALRERRIRSHPGGDRLLHRLLHGRHLRDSSEFPAHMVGLDVRRVPGAEHRRRGALIPGHAGGDAGGARRARHLLDQRLSASRFQPLGAEYRA